jgi:hypothetical protein
MALDVHWSFTVSVPELETLRQTLLTLGAQLMDQLQGIHDAIGVLTESQAQGSEAIAAQLTVIADELSQFSAGAISQADLAAVEAKIRDAAAIATQQAADIRANSQQITTIVPDTPAPPA